MTYPVYAYLFGLLLALPVFALVAVFAVMLARLLFQWLVDDGPTPAAKARGEAKGQPDPR